ncbi:MULTISPECIES: amino acid ABC transporter substrate-binding protein [unclassified Variovorax]|uniref:amino acid ABC transporter substrate-binding protein n=1 Tax=unclassified Variovorax TaxID=663243 RepID=UPI001BD477B9|nr:MULTISPECIES: amino acid ABC transporter substrate-binding protein [unclassified Variovorax]
MNTSGKQGTTHLLHRLGRALLCLALAAPALASAAGTLDKARESGKLTFGYRVDTRPFAYNDEGGKPAGFSVALCQGVAETMKTELKLPALTVDFVPVSAAERFDALSQGKVDLLCETATPTMERRASFDFSLPIFFSGVGAVLRADTPARMRDALADRPEVSAPVWRGAPAAFLANVVFAVVGGSTIEQSLLDAMSARRIQVSVTRVPDYATGLQMVRDGRAAALFGDRPVLVEAAKRAPSAGDLIVIQRNFTREPLSLAMRRGDDAFRLVVNRSLSKSYLSKEFAPLYTGHFGPPDTGTIEFYQAIALPE